MGDAAAAKGAGLHFIASMESGIRTKQDFEAYPADKYIKAFPQVVAAVSEIEQNEADIEPGN